MNTNSPLLDKADAPASRSRSSSAPARGGSPPIPPGVAAAGPTPLPGDDARTHLFRQWLAALDRRDGTSARVTARALKRLGVIVRPTAGGRP